MPYEKTSRHTVESMHQRVQGLLKRTLLNVACQVDYIRPPLCRKNICMHELWIS